MAATFFATLLMLLLHVVEWQTASALAERLRSESKAVAEVRRLRWAIRSEALYYLLILPYLHSTPRSLPARLLAIAAIYHWGGLALSEGSGLFDKWAVAGAAFGSRKVVAISAIAVLDTAEMLLLGWLLWILVASLVPTLAPVTAVTGIPAYQA